MTTDSFRSLCAELLADYESNRFRAELAAEARAALAEEAGVGPTDEELDGFAVQWWAGFAHLERGADAATPITSIVAIRHFRNFLRDALARYGTHPRPIPVEERLPTEADCDAEGCAWWYRPESVAYFGRWVLAPMDMPPGDYLYWLPAAAIPLPEASP